jgi:biopolymer transport protein ExbD
MKFKRPKISEVDFSSNVINLIDVLLLLLIFFMLTTTFTQTSRLTLTLPEANAKAVEQMPRRIEVVITAQGHFNINERNLVNSELATVIAALRETAAGDTTLPLVITADANTPHQYVVRAMDAAGQLGFSNLSLTTQQPAQASP